jgi:hypothetical protein
MGYLPRAITASILIAQFAVLCAASPAFAISADLANKCREMAIKAHPPPVPPGGKAYAQAERDFFNECIAKNGQMQSTEPPKDANSHK